MFELLSDHTIRRPPCTVAAVMLLVQFTLFSCLNNAHVAQSVQFTAMPMSIMMSTPTSQMVAKYNITQPISKLICARDRLQAANCSTLGRLPITLALDQCSALSIPTMDLSIIMIYAVDGRVWFS
jgi:hypothetical protein